MRSLKSQVDHALHAVCRFGESRYEHKLAGTAGQFIFSHQSLETHRGALHPLVQFCRDQFGLRKIVDLKPAMVRAYMDHKRAEGCSVKTLEGIRTALQKLERGVQVAYGVSERRFFPRDYKLEAFRPEDTTKIRLHTPEKAQEMVAWARENIHAKAAFGLSIAKEMGLRSGEIAALRCCSVRLNGLTPKDLKELNETGLRERDRAEYAKIGRGPCVYLHGSLDGAKNGRHRVVSIPAHLVPAFRQAIQGRENSQERLLDVSQRTVQSWENKARTATGSTGKGVHGLRRAYVVQTIRAGLARGIPFEELVRRLSLELGHSRAQIIAWYFGE